MVRVRYNQEVIPEEVADAIARALNTSDQDVTGTTPLADEQLRWNLYPYIVPVPVPAEAVIPRRRTISGLGRTGLLGRMFDKFLSKLAPKGKLSNYGVGFAETGEVLPLRDDPNLPWYQATFEAGVLRDYGRPDQELSLGQEPEKHSEG